jgi:hypothetical protein
MIQGLKKALQPKNAGAHFNNNQKPVTLYSLEVKRLCCMGIQQKLVKRQYCSRLYQWIRKNKKSLLLYQRTSFKLLGQHFIFLFSTNLAALLPDNLTLCCIKFMEVAGIYNLHLRNLRDLVT